MELHFQDVVLKLSPTSLTLNFNFVFVFMEVIQFLRQVLQLLSLRFFSLELPDLSFR